MMTSRTRAGRRPWGKESLRVGVFVSESGGGIAVRCVELLNGKPPMVQLMMSPIVLFLENN